MVAIFSRLTIIASASFLLASQSALAQLIPGVVDIPSSCEDDCQPLSNAWSSECHYEYKCICVDATVDKYAVCLKCAPPTGMDAQFIIDAFADNCNREGYPVKSTGGSPSATAPGSGPSSGSGSSGGNGAVSFSAKNSGALTIVALGATLLLA